MSTPTLYYSPTSCGAASWLAQSIAGLNLPTVEVVLQTHKTVKGDDYYSINPKGNVPALVFPNGRILNEGAAVLQWIADKKPESHLLPPTSDDTRYDVINVFNYVGTDLHAAGFGPLFNPAWDEKTRDTMKQNVAKRVKYLDDTILAGGKKYAVGNGITIADIYLYIVLSWAGYVGVDLSSFNNVQAYQKTISEDAKFSTAYAALQAAKQQ